MCGTRPREQVEAVGGYRVQEGRGWGWGVVCLQEVVCLQLMAGMGRGWPGEMEGRRKGETRLAVNGPSRSASARSKGEIGQARAGLVGEGSEWMEPPYGGPAGAGKGIGLAEGNRGAAPPDAGCGGAALSETQRLKAEVSLRSYR